VETAEESANLKGKENQEVFEEFVKVIKGPAGHQCRFGVFDFEYEVGPGEGTRKKIIFFAWSDDDAKIKQKMVYSSSKDSIRKCLDGVQVEIQCTDDSEINFESVLEKCKKNSR